MFRFNSIKSIGFDLCRIRNESKSILLSTIRAPSVSHQYYYSRGRTKVPNLLKCNVEEASKIYKKLEPSNCSVGRSLNTINVLTKNGVRMDSIVKNSWLFRIRLRHLESRLQSIQEMRPNTIDELVPLLKCDWHLLRKIAFISKQETERLPKGYNNRIYYFSDKLEVTPEVISKRFANHSFMLTNNFESLNRLLEIFFRYGIAPIHLFNDITVFKSCETHTVKRLGRVKEAGITPVMPWMVKCRDSTFTRMIENRIEEREALAGNDVETFYMDIFSIDRSKVIEMLEQYPRLATRKIRTVKPIINYLLIETDYTAADILSTPQILYFSLKTIQKRIKMLEKANCQHPKLVELIQGTERFDRFVQRFSKYGNKQLK